ncbi:HPF/RaiA family ribosome-associated protein [Sorangium sp. So ce1335]|uniref:HPF/RaiA family ribosome-associated protein n=1 Tax=Sorangium sp. So ce1335 TaxID=3133335 RepID=UPI003F639FA0
MSKMHKPSRRAAFAGEIARPITRANGRTPADNTPVAVRTTGLDIDQEVRDYARQRLGIRLGKFSAEIQRVSVRLEDVNGPRGGVDTVCRIKVVLRGLPTVVAQDVAEGIREAIDRASHIAERSVRRALGRSRPAAAALRDRRWSASPLAARGARAAEGETAEARRRKRRPLPMPEGGSLIGRRVGRRADNLERAAEQRREPRVDTAQPGWSSTDRRAGGSSTAARNTKLNTSRAAATLEDSAADRPSRKSTRKSANRQKQDNNLRQRQTRAARSPKARAARATARP